MLKIALTGPSGSGKGYIGALLTSRGVPVYDTDEAVHRLYADRAFSARLQDALGCDILGENGFIDRRKLGAVVFADENKMQALYALVYPAVRALCRDFLRDAAKNGCRAAAVDAPQLFEAGFEGDYDEIISISAPKRERLARILRRDGIGKEQALLRMAHQMSQRAYNNRATAVIHNGARDDASEQLDRLLEKWGVNQ